LVVANQIKWKAKRNAEAYAFARRAADVAPNNPYVWLNLGMVQDSIYLFDDAEASFKKGMSVATNDDQKGAIYLNWGCMLVNSGQWERAEKIARKCLQYRPDKPKAKANLGLALLALKRWDEGWKLYDSIIGFDVSRRRMQYMNEGEWDGTKGQNVIIYEEQGIGDAISFASMIPDALNDMSGIIECDYKLEGLFKRSFPTATVYGTRYDNATDWQGNHKIDASISMGALGKHYRQKDEDFHGEPYLIPDPERVEMWKALFAKTKKPVIGIAWSGGVDWTGARNREWGLEELLPVFESVDAVWVSLQYKDASKEIARFKAKHPNIDLRQYPFGTLTKDYDDTAAMVSAMDMVFSMQTAVIHLAGAIGKECWCFVNKHSQWRYGLPSETLMPWYKSVRLWRWNNGWPIDEAAKELHARFK
jgi:tetratricopeptide (TPR) repeat protein